MKQRLHCTKCRFMALIDALNWVLACLPVSFKNGGLYSPPLFHMESTWNMPHSMWIPYGIHHFIWNMFWLRSHSFWALHSFWNPYGMVMEWPNSTWNDGMSMWIPYGIISTIPCGFHMDSME